MAVRVLLFFLLVCVCVCSYYVSVYYKRDGVKSGEGGSSKQLLQAETTTSTTSEEKG